MSKELPHEKQHDLRGASLMRIGKRLRTRAGEIAKAGGCKRLTPLEKLEHPPIDHSVTSYILQIVAEEIEAEGKEAQGMR
jgi:hypothetical protein